MSHRLKGSCTDELECRGGITYHVEFSLEPVERETFWTYQKELTQAGARDGLLHCFEPSGRFGLGALSYINLESRDRSLKVLVFNAQNSTPDVRAVVDRAEAQRLPVVAITETQAPADLTYQDWQTRQLNALLAALGG